MTGNEHRAPSADLQKTFGRVTVRLLGGESIELLRKGAPGAGKSHRSVMWCREQIEGAMIAAQRRKGIDASEQFKAMRWALGEIAAGKGGEA